MTSSYDPHPFLNIFTYDVEFSDGEIEQHSVNVIAENMHSQVDEDGSNIQILDSIVDYRKDKMQLIRLMCMFATRAGSSSFVTQPLFGLS